MLFGQGFNHLFVIRVAGNVLGDDSWVPGRRGIPGYREALIDITVCVNAAHAAFDVLQEVGRAAKWEIKVLYAVFSLPNHQVSMPVNPHAAVSHENVNLACEPINPKVKRAGSSDRERPCSRWERHRSAPRPAGARARHNAPG